MGFAYSANDQGSLSGITSEAKAIQEVAQRKTCQYICDLHSTLLEGGIRSSGPQHIPDSYGICFEESS